MAHSAASSRRRVWIGNLALVLGSLVFFCGLLEAGVRIAHPNISIPQSPQHFQFSQSFEFQLPHHRRDSVLGWTLQPGQYGATHVNSLGFRGPEWRPAKPPGAERIAHLGDSCTMGFTIPADGDVYGALLEGLLRQRRPDTEALNFGVDGYSSYQGRLLLDRVFEYRPDYVTLYFGYNDHHFANKSDRQTQFALPGSVQLLERSHAFRFLRRQILLRRGGGARLVRPERRVDLPEFESNLRAMIETSRARGAMPILLTTPLRPGIPLIENEVLAQEPGGAEWVTQDWWVSRQLAARGVQPQTPEGTAALRQVLDDGLRRHPDWPWLHYLCARELARAGDAAGARAELQQAVATDAERRVMDAYNERVRVVSQALGVELVDLAREFEARASTPLFNDVVHPNPMGHKLIAELLAARIERLEEAKASPGG
jgi:lysophospholipase L1-like esterase